MLDVNKFIYQFWVLFDLKQFYTITRNWIKYFNLQYSVFIFEYLQRKGQNKD